jgi:hypothetical protein
MAELTALLKAQRSKVLSAFTKAGESALSKEVRIQVSRGEFAARSGGIVP